MKQIQSLLKDVIESGLSKSIPLDECGLVVATDCENSYQFVSAYGEAGEITKSLISAFRNSQLRSILFAAVFNYVKRNQNDSICQKLIADINNLSK